MKKILLAGLMIFWVLGTAIAQDPSIYNEDPAQRFPVGMEEPGHQVFEPTGGPVAEFRVDPPNWWIGMQEPRVELMLHGTNIRDLEPVLEEYPGVKISKVTRLESPNYLFVELLVGPGAKQGNLSFVLNNEEGKKAQSFRYQLRNRNYPEGKGLPQMTPADVMYLIMPDRFANGDPNNDSFEDMEQVGINRSKMYFRHGGDLQGIMNHLDYFKDLGISSLWLNPILENNQPYESYHGYAFTDHYQVDRRLGSNELFQQLTDSCRKVGIKMVMDIVHNHVGDQHWFIQDIPSKDWIHQFPEYTQTQYRATTLMDPYASETDRNRMSDGWFAQHMPDLNQKHPQLATYLIQNNIWWIEYAGLAGYRVDTYAYPDQGFMADWGARIQEEYPDFLIFGETWVHGPAVQAQFTQDNDLREGYNSHLPNVTDFQLYYGIKEALTKPQNWTDGVSRLYYTLAQDFLYEEPYHNVTFLDNHDIDRFWSVVGRDMRKFKSALAFLFTTRGIPCIYYGTELPMGNFADPDGKVRADFPGGWEGDATNKFTEAGRTEQEQELFNYISTLAKYRQNTPALQYGSLMQFVPENGVYVYFRRSNNKTVMVIMNTSIKTVTLDVERYQEGWDGFRFGRDVTSKTAYLFNEPIEISPYGTLVLELQR